jgi:ribonuclease HII
LAESAFNLGYTRIDADAGCRREDSVRALTTEWRFGVSFRSVCPRGSACIRVERFFSLVPTNSVRDESGFFDVPTPGTALSRLAGIVDHEPVPHFRLERAAGGRVAGVDEAGRGPLSGPVLAAAVVFPRGVSRELRALLDDSKKLTAAQRDAAFAALRRSTAEIAIAAASVAEIERLNILQAGMLAMRRAVARLPAVPDLALVDGNVPPALRCPVRCVVGGDGISLSIAAASIVAKVTRDRLMRRLDQRYPGYSWATNAGYPTEAHRRALEALGPTRHHRALFGPVARMLAAANTGE